MESKHKNALIGALLAVVFVMAVGYAAFAQLLTINGTATIDSSWDVHFDPAQTTSTAVVIVNGGSDTTTAGTISYADSLDTSKPTVATLTANLKQPGDTVTFTLKPTNYGTLPAKPAANPVIVAGTNENAGTGAGQLNIAADGQSATKGNIKWEIVSTGTTVSASHTLTAASGDDAADTIIVRASFIGGENEAVASGQSAAIKIEINYQQA